MSGLVLLELVLAAVIFPILFFIPAPYGRHRRPGWGPMVPARLGWIVMEAPAVVVPLLVYPGGGAGWILLVAWEVHYLQRTLVFPLRMRGGGSKPLLTVAMAFGFNILNGTINGRALGGWHVDATAVLGLLLFAAGLAINWQSDAILRALRPPGATGYQIPYGGLYRWVSAPNYLGEIVEWAGFALAARTPAALAFLGFSIANLLPRAVWHHRWYRAQFPDYPPERRAIIPFLL